ncbi:MAG: TIGR00730 family Rossman fold protein [Bacteroidaceae bacterium]|nr:TIGR00730 family Rossman fold protein [Bacteroidaceae bacterium]
MNRIGIFCSACETIDSCYFDCARELGQWMGEQGKTLVYGGANLGLMECVAQAVKSHGGGVVGVVPTKLEERGRVSELPDVLFRTENLSERKEVIVRESEVLIALPGGVGTLDEVFHVMAAATIGYHRKRVIFYNVNGFWDDLIGMLQQMEQKGFIRKPLAESYSVVTTLEEMAQMLY